MKNQGHYVHNNIEVSGLSPRRCEALALRASGLTYKRCAQIMGCSADNVKNRIDDLYFLLHANSTPQLITKSIQKGYLKILTLAIAFFLGLAQPVDHNNYARVARNTRNNSQREQRIS